ncbi:MAG: ATP synthase F1 subunit gamma [Breznakia sp.]
MASKLEIKNRIQSVDSTKKITKAMQLVASSKLQKAKRRMEENKEYATYLKETVNNILATSKDSLHRYLKRHESDEILSIIYTSDMGLCGGYNANIYRLIHEELNLNHPIIVLGARGSLWLNRRKFNVIKSIANVDEEAYEDIVDIAKLALQMYESGEIGGIQILYTQYINSLNLQATRTKLLPLEPNEELAKKVGDTETIFEPSGDAILDDLFPLYSKSILYSYWIETKTSEQAMRRMAMESATKNAQELHDQLELEFNLARQSAITQEITEIVGGASALED